MTAMEDNTASSSARTCSLGESDWHSVIIPPTGPWVFPASFSLFSILRNLNLDNCSMSSFDAPSCFLYPHRERERERERER